MSAKYLIRNASITTFWRTFGMVSGTALDAVILAHFGVGAETDALFASLAIPMLITSALDIQTPKVLVPTLIACTEEGGNESISELVSTVITMFAAILCVVVLALSAFAHVLIRIQVPGFQTGAMHVGVRLFLILVWLTFLQGLAPVLQSFLFSQHRFLVPSLTRLVTTFPAIIAVTIWHATLGIYSVAIGIVFGSLLQLVLLGATTRIHGLNLRLRWDPTNARVRGIVKMFGHPILGHVLSDGKVIVENFLASLLGGGALSVLRYASRIVEAISGVLLTGIVTSSLPLISAYASEKNIGEMKRSVLDAIRLIAFLALPISCWLIFTGQSMVVLLFEHGRFSRVDATHIAMLIAFLSPYVIFSRLIGITQTPFYATLDTKTPLLSVILFLSAYITSASILSRIVGIYGFAIASSFASLMTALTMSALLHRAFGPLGWKLLNTFGLRLAIVMAFTICALAVGQTIGGQYLSESLQSKLIRFLAPTTFGFTAFVIGSIAVRLLGKRHLEALVSR